MACSVPHSYDQIKSMIEKQIQEDRGRQLAIMNLAHEFNDACTAKDDYELSPKYKINISYQQAWRGKDYGIEQIKGSPYESFEMLPYYCHNLERKNQRTITRIKTNEKGVFEMLFISIGASIRTFLIYLRLLLIIDETYLKGLYQGTNLVAVDLWN
ncbi:hypothetical protein Tco_0277598 [Tanacetum coccineum]